MKFKIDRKEFLVGLQIVQPNSTKEFPNVKIDVTESSIKLTTNNSESMMVYNVPLETNGNQTFCIILTGSAILSCKKLINVLKKMKNEVIDIEYFENTVVVSNTQHTSKFQFNVEVKFFEEQLIEEAPQLYVDAEEMKKSLNSVVRCISKNEIRPVLTTLNMKYDRDELKFIGTDSYRLGQFICDCDKDIIRGCEPFDLGINLKPLYNVINKLNSSIEITINENVALFVFDNVYYQVKALKGTFPDTRQFIPKTFGIEVYVNLQEFKASLERLKNFTNERKVVKFEINHTVSLSVETEDVKAEEILTESEVHSGDLKIACNIDFLLDALKTLKTETIVIGFNGSLYPFVLKDSSDKNDKNIQLIVPIRVE